MKTFATEETEARKGAGGVKTFIKEDIEVHKGADAE